MGRPAGVPGAAFLCARECQALSENGTPALELVGINKSFGAVHVLHDVDLAVYPGEVTALVGDNGAGKSTLVKCIAGIHSIDSGSITFEGKPIVISDPRFAAALGIEFVYQDLALSDNLDITQNMFLGREIRRFGFLADGLMERKARETLTACPCAPSLPCGSPSPASPAASGRRWPSPRPSSGTARSSSSTSRRPRSVSRRPVRCST